MKLGLIGLGRMGSGIAKKLIREGHELVVWNRTQTASEEFKNQKSSPQMRDPDWKLSAGKVKKINQELKVARTVEELVGSLEKPRVIWLMIDAKATEEVLQEISKYTEKGDILIDGGNAYYKDSDKRFRALGNSGIRYLGIGVSGGIIASKTGYSLMAGGDVSAYQYITTILESLSKPNGGHEYFGQGGAGHFIKMVHNAIEYGYMQSIGEGFGLLNESSYDLDLKKVAEIYQKGSLLSGFMMERTIEVLGKDPKLSSLDGVVGKATGETIWAVEEAKKKGLLFDIIRRSLEVRNKSEEDPKIQKSFAARMVSALRAAFGGHAVTKK